MSPGDDRPVTSREFRNLLHEHLQSMTQAWQEMSGRVSKVEGELHSNKKEKDLMYSRIAQTERKQADSASRIDRMEKDIAEMKAGGQSSRDGPPRPVPSDPWMAYRSQHGPLPPKTGGAGSAGGGGGAVPEGALGGRDPGGGREELSEEDRRTLVFGGWLQDSKRQTILEEGGAFLRREDVASLVDSSELIVYGPRRSFGLLRFKLVLKTNPRMYAIACGRSFSAFGHNLTASRPRPRVVPSLVDRCGLSL